MKEKNICSNCSCNYLNSFSHVYIEKDILTHPIAREIMGKLPTAQTIIVDDYADVFHRPRQRFDMQKKSPKLILARKKFDFLYTGSKLCEDFGEDNFYYSSSIMNCLYDCDYCYLQGMYFSANIVVFVNIEDYFAAVDPFIKDRRVYLCLSYDSDLLVFEHLTHFASRWIDYAAHHPQLLVEIRTKSANFQAIAHKDIPDNVILAWTLSPQQVIEAYENGTPSLKARLNSINQAIAKGLRVRLSFEPLIAMKDYKKIYKEFVGGVFETIPPSAIRDINIGVFRMSKEHFKRIEKMKPYSKVFAYEMHSENKAVRYKQEEEMKKVVYDEVIKYVDKEKVYG